MSEGSHDGQKIPATPDSIKPAVKDRVVWRGVNTALGLLSLASALSFAVSAGYDVATSGDDKHATVADLSDDVDPNTIRQYSPEGIQAYYPEVMERFYKENKGAVDAFSNLTPTERKETIVEFLQADISHTDGTEPTSASRAAGAAFIGMMGAAGALAASEITRQNKVNGERNNLAPTSPQLKPSV